MYVQYNTFCISLFLIFENRENFPRAEMSPLKKPRKCKLRAFHLQSLQEKERHISPASHPSSYCPPIPSSIKTRFLSYPKFLFFPPTIVWEHKIFSPRCAFCLGYLSQQSLKLGFSLSWKVEHTTLHINCFKQYLVHRKYSRFAIIHAFPTVALVQFSHGKSIFGGSMGKGMGCSVR